MFKIKTLVLLLLISANCIQAAEKNPLHAKPAVSNGDLNLLLERTNKFSDAEKDKIVRCFFYKIKYVYAMYDLHKSSSASIDKHLKIEADNLLKLSKEACDLMNEYSKKIVDIASKYPIKNWVEFCKAVYNQIKDKQKASINAAYELEYY